MYTSSACPRRPPVSSDSTDPAPPVAARRVVKWKSAWHQRALRSGLLLPARRTSASRCVTLGRECGWPAWEIIAGDCSLSITTTWPLAPTPPNVAQNSKRCRTRRPEPCSPWAGEASGALYGASGEILFCSVRALAFHGRKVGARGLVLGAIAALANLGRLAQLRGVQRSHGPKCPSVVNVMTLTATLQAAEYGSRSGNEPPPPPPPPPPTPPPLPPPPPPPPPR
jgi:hypothetical protein